MKPRPRFTIYAGEGRKLMFSRRTLFGFWAVFSVPGDWEGSELPPIEDRIYLAMLLDEATEPTYMEKK